MKAAILSIGSEIVQGFLSDTNSTFLARELNQVGVEVVGVFQVGDDLDRLGRALSRAMDDADLVVCTGGIGPTADDLTREAIAAICNEQPLTDPETLEAVRSYYRRRGSEMPVRNEKQAWKIPSAEILPNRAGTAPGWFVRKAGKFIVAMPGIPREMMPMWQEQALPRFSPHLDTGSIEVETLKTIGIGESLVEQMLQNVIDRGFPIVSTYAKNDGVHVRIVAAAADPIMCKDAVQKAQAEIRNILGDNVYGNLDISLPKAVLLPLVENGNVVDILEAGTGGQVAALLLSDDSVAHSVREARVRASLEADRSEPGVNDPIGMIRRGLDKFHPKAVGDFRLGVAVAFGDRDPMGRYDARIGILVQSDAGESSSKYTVAASPSDIGRRASLHAAEALRRAVMAATALHRS